MTYGWLDCYKRVIQRSLCGGGRLVSARASFWLDKKKSETFECFHEDLPKPALVPPTVFGKRTWAYTVVVPENFPWDWYFDQRDANCLGFKPWPGSLRCVLGRANKRGRGGGGQYGSSDPKQRLERTLNLRPSEKIGRQAKKISNKTIYFKKYRL